jgi:hypothetical protein
MKPTTNRERRYMSQDLKGKKAYYPGSSTFMKKKMHRLKRKQDKKTATSTD